ncbi:putative short-chain dehydrogenase [Aspergillus rambellii]|uniref:Putative short-chain dehydrogenase n=1 Tax=Aspergillus rambellii TaxID=308745 RepID=A0A0F8ULP8_9EURO|nr:putative short-chain dehydrogenase [Aspergillus rambellii]
MAAFLAAALNPTNYIGGVSFHPDRDIQDLSEKVVLVTGGNTGLGKETIRQLLKHNPRQVFLAARSEAKARNAIGELESGTSKGLKISWLPLDLASNTSIENAVKEFQAESSRLDILILNAGVMALPLGETDMGHEIQLGTNYIGHFLLTRLLLPTLLKTAEEPQSDVRVVTLSSIGHNLAPSFLTILNQRRLKDTNANTRYGASKVANILFAAELARRHPSIRSVSVHPGIILTDLYTPFSEQSILAAASTRVIGLFASSVYEGALNQLWAAAGAKREELVNGGYYMPVGILKSRNKYARSKDMGKHLWDWTEAELRIAGIII